MNSKWKDDLPAIDPDKVVKWQKPSRALIDTIEAEKEEVPDWSLDVEADPVEAPHRG